jgi:signal transduction histidine kinase
VKAFGAKFGSVRVRITALGVLIVFIALALGGAGLLGLLRRGTLRSARTDVQVRAAEVAALGQQKALPRPLPPIVGELPTLLQVVEANGTVSTASAQLLDREPLFSFTNGSPVRGRAMELSVGSRGAKSRWWVQAEPTTINGRSTIVIVATSLLGPDQTLAELRALLGVGVPLLCLLAGLLTWLVIGRALRPVEQMRRDVAELAQHGHGVTGGSVIEPAIDDEIGRLARTLNQLLARLDHSSTMQRRFVADASHELRGPVANIRVALEVAQAHPELTDWVRISDEVLEQDNRMGRLVDDLLFLARSDDDLARRRNQELNVGDVVKGAVTMKSQTLESARVSDDRGGSEAQRRVAVRLVRCDTAPVLDDPDQVLSIITNLLDNAVRFASSQVTVSVAATPGWMELTVIDDGPGIPEADRELIFDRFYRVDQHRSREGGGAGLGLSIVARLVSEREGTVQVGDAKPGARFTVRLPLAASKRVLRR